MRWIGYNKNQELTRWHRWFAWHPVIVGYYPDGSDIVVWLEWVERCGEYKQLSECIYGYEWSYQEVSK